MKFSLVVGTLGRTAELRRMLDSLLLQPGADLEVLIIDQNADERVAPLIALYREQLHIIHVRRSQPGLSAARNLGLNSASGEIVTFPDDDCWYPVNFFTRLSEFFNTNAHIDGLSCTFVDDGGRPGYVWWDTKEGQVKKRNLFNRTGSITMFFRRAVIDRIGGFDETMGLGASTPWQGAEDLDYMARAVRAGFNIRYRPQWYVYHKSPGPINKHVIAKSQGYARAMGRLLRKHSYPSWFLAYWLAGSCGLMLIAFARGDLLKAQFHWAGIVGKLRGWIDYAPELEAFTTPKRRPEVARPL
jgi:glycosyltransferase involved in cell wall biosynthesis